MNRATADDNVLLVVQLAALPLATPPVPYLRPGTSPAPGDRPGSRPG